MTAPTCAYAGRCYMRLISGRNRPMRWRCLLCKPARWHVGTFADWQYHYTVLHNQKEK